MRLGNREIFALILARAGDFKNGLLLLALVASVSTCSDESLNSPSPSTDALFSRYIAMGNSITAGFQSGGINDSTQRQSYAALLALQMDTEFIIPSLAIPGCPAPIVDILTQERVGGASESECALRSNAPSHINNVAVPGSAVFDPISNIAEGNSANLLTTMILGGLTQLEMARRVKPTFMSVWIGNNDVLGAAISGDLTQLTDPAEFAARYSAMMDTVDAMGVDAGVLVSVVNVTSAPFFTAGAAYWQAEALGALPPALDVLDTCAPAALGGSGEASLVPFDYGFGVLIAQALQGTSVTLDCELDEPVLVTVELLRILNTVALYNTTVQAEAAERGWAYADINALVLNPLLITGGIALFPDVSNVTAPFGPAVSRDGVHPSASTHILIANAISAAINATYDISLAEIR